LDNGQYNEAWKYIHNLPEDVLKAAQDLKAKRIFPVHSSKFALAAHARDEPLVKLTELNKSYNIPLVTPIIGEMVNLQDTTKSFKQWWVGIK
jgi:L-ascorbate metabolism protein UlaG (beta-lactamase superfamily)